MKKTPLMKSISGIRGVVGKSLTPPIILNYSAAFGQFVKGRTVVVGRDSRPSGEYISGLVINALAMAGCRVIDLGVVPTPTVELAVIHHKAAGGVAITASHNPAQWNALKFFNSLGEFITKSQYKRLEAIISSGKYVFRPHNQLGGIEYDQTAIERHIEGVRQLSAIYPKKIRAGRLTAVVDAVNGAGSSALPDLLERLGVRVIRINCNGDGDFVHEPEPVPKNLGQLGRAVKKHRADLGLACDPDADRLALVDETGRPIGEELTLTLAVAYYLRKARGPVVINLSTSRATADVARMMGSQLFLSSVGEANVIAEMKKRSAVIGGEGNGGVILPESHYGRDALVAAGLIISFMAESGHSLSRLAGTMPAYWIIKKKAPLPEDFVRKISRVEARIRKMFAQCRIDRRDGVRLDFDGGWVQVRASNTEPIYRLIVETRTQVLTGRLAKLVEETLK